MIGQSLFYMGEHDLAHKILAIVEEEGAERAAYALKLLQSEGQLTIASTGKDPTTGRLVTQEYRVQGPVMIFLTTTAVEIDEELLNRCIVLTVDEGREQTRAIHETQRESQTLEGVLAKEARSQVLKVHRDAQRLLRSILVVNPYAKELTFLDHQTRTRRDHMKYLTLIRSIALLHQYQRPVKTVEQGGRVVRYIEATKADITMANRLAHEVLGRSLDELPPQSRTLLELLDEQAIAWVERYLDVVRPTLVMHPDPGNLFLTQLGEPFSPSRMTQLVRNYVNAADTGKKGACHLFRHTMATLMLENGADIRFIQEMLGHVELSTTQIYTQVSIRMLREIHRATHPTAKSRRTKAQEAQTRADDNGNGEEDLLADLAADDEDEDED